MTKYLAIIGYPLRHSVSPSFQQAAIDHCGLDVRYDIWETGPVHLRERVDGMRRPEILGANVTVPYKEVVLPLVDELDGLARRIGAVNTIVNRGGRLMGYNTDAGGFLRALRDEAGFEPQGKRAVILGAGGVARAAGFALADSGIGSIAIINRTFERAERLARDLKSPGLEVTALPFVSERLEEALAHCDLLVNCTSIGMRYSPTEGQSPLEAELIPEEALVYDLVYNPVETPLLKDAKAAGARTLGGLAMLVYQGAASFELWTGGEAPLDIMFEAAREAI